MVLPLPKKPVITVTGIGAIAIVVVLLRSPRSDVLVSCRPRQVCDALGGSKSFLPSRSLDQLEGVHLWLSHLVRVIHAAKRHDKMRMR